MLVFPTPERPPRNKALLRAVISGPGSCVKVIEADELNVAVCSRGAKLGGGLAAAEEEQAGGFRAGPSGADQEVPDVAQAGEVPHADRLGPLGLADREQDAPAAGVVAEGRDADLV